MAGLVEGAPWSYRVKVLPLSKSLKGTSKLQPQLQLQSQTPIMPSLPTDIPADFQRGSRQSISRSFGYGAPIAQASIARDLEEASDSDAAESDDESEAEDVVRNFNNQASHYSFAGTYRRPSFTVAGARGAFPPIQADRERLSKAERERAIGEERSLLRDNNLILPKHPQDGPRRRSSIFDGPHLIKTRTQETEVTPLLGDPSLPYGGQDDPQKIAAKWDEAVAAGAIQTTWQRETKVILGYSIPLMVTFILQYSLTVASVFTVGHIGTAELGAVSLASMTANITGYAIYQGLSTSLDTLCAQAYGSGHKKLVGLQTQRMIYFLWFITIPIAIVWLSATRILERLVPEYEVAQLAGLYLKVVLLGAPGFAAFEAGKRFVQAQGLFRGALYVLLFCAPFNAFLNWLLVWKFEMGFVGAPIAVAVTDNLLPIGLLIYIRLSKTGMSCWNGFTSKAFQNWGPMIKLAGPGLLMVEAEVLAFEILTFASSYFGVTPLASQSVLATITSLTWQIPFPLSIASSTRVANLIGATLADAAKTCTRVTFTAAAIVGVLNVILLSSLKGEIPKLFTDNAEVIQIVAATLPICAAFQFFDAITANCNGVLRGLGRQEFGGYVQLFCYYVVAMPISFGTAFGLGWELRGLWTGVAIALGLVALIELTYLIRTDWEKSVEEARNRNTMDA